MKKVLTASSNEVVITAARKACKKYASYFECVVFSDTQKAIKYMDRELPEIKVLDFSSDSVDSQKILDNIDSDAWFRYGGIVAVCKDERQAAEIEGRKNPNILALQTIDGFSDNFSRILKILWQNQQFLFDRGIKDVLGGQESGNFICDNSALDIQFYTNFLVSYLFNTGRISAEKRETLQKTMTGHLEDALKSIAGDGEDSDKKIIISYAIGKITSEFKIAVEGNAEGVSFEIENLKASVNKTTSVMKSFKTEVYMDKQVVCWEGELGTDIFFIVSGRLAVYVGGKLVSVLTPNDLFVGEMAFLLNERRTATVLAVGACRLIRIPKSAFLSLIRKNPHYGIFLSKMLAQRLQKQTQRVVELQDKLKSQGQETENV